MKSPMRPISLVIAFLLLLCGSSLAQEGATAQSTATGKATVYIFRIPHARTIKRNAPPVFCDEVLLAKLDRGRFFRIELDPGTHTFRTDRKRDGGVEIKLEADKTYYLRMEMEISYTVKNVRLLVATPEDSTYTIKQLEPVKPQDIKDPRVIAGL